MTDSDPTDPTPGSAGPAAGSAGPAAESAGPTLPSTGPAAGSAGRLPVRPVTAAAVREGDPVVLGAFVHRHGGAAVAYLAELVPAGGALRAAASALADLRVVLLTAAPDDTDPADGVLPAVRRAVARHAENPLRPEGRRRTAERTPVCERIPRLLVAFADGRLPREDELRLLEHVRACPDCHAMNAALTRAEGRFREGASTALTPAEVGGLVAAMALASAG